MTERPELNNVVRSSKSYRRNKTEQNRQETKRTGHDNDRMAAYQTLREVLKQDAYSNIALNFSIGNGRITNPAFVRELVYGVIKYRKLLDFYIDQLVRDGLKSVSKDILILLEAGVYQILFMDSVPDHSAVDESVKIAKAVSKGKSGFVNGVLRNFLRNRNSLQKPEEIKDRIRRLSVMYSCDETIARLLISQYGFDAARTILRASLKTPPLFVHVNTLKTDIKTLSGELKHYLPESGEASDRDKKRHTARYEGLPVLEVRGSRILETKSFKEGKFFIQDISSVNAILHFGPKPGETLIDVCSAPGGKSMAMACLMENSGIIHAFDLHENRLKPVRKTAENLGITIIETEQHDAAEASEKYVRTADKVICDVPCSGLGVMRRKPEIRYKKFDCSLDRLYETQYKILSSSSRYVRPGGKLMYSTCSINKKENEDITSRFLKEHDEFKVTDSYLTLPGTDGVSLYNTDEMQPDCMSEADGFYYCIMEKRS